MESETSIFRQALQFQLQCLANFKLGAEPPPEEAPLEEEINVRYQSPVRLVRTCLSSLDDSKAFGFLMESFVKEMNWRVKGTEKFWNDLSGANPSLALKAASLCGDNRIEHLLTTK